MSGIGDFSRRTVLGGGAAALALSVGGRGRAAMPEGLDESALRSPSNMRFRAVYEGLPVGLYTAKVTLGEAPGDFTIDYACQFSVGLFVFDVWTFEHESREIWRGGELQSIKGWTTEQDRHDKVHGRIDGDSFLVESTRWTYRTPRPALTSSTIWAADMSGEREIVDAQKGRRLIFRVLEDRYEPLEFNNRWVEARRITFTTNRYDGDFWRARDGTWLKAYFERAWAEVEFLRIL